MVGAKAGRGHHELGALGHVEQVLSAQTDIHIQNLQDAGAFLDDRGGVRTDHGDESTALGKCVGRREPADAEAGHQDVQRGPVGISMGEVAQPLTGFITRVKTFRALHR